MASTGGALFQFNTPTATQIYDHFQQASAQKAMQQERLNALRQERQDNLVKYAGEALNNKNFATGTEADPLINTKLNELKQKYFGMIMKNPSMGDAELNYLIAQDTQGIGQYSQQLQALRKNIETSSEGLKNYKGLNAGQVQALAINDAIYKTDEKGNKVLKDPGEIDPNQDYITGVFDRHPDKLHVDDAVWDDARNKANYQVVSDKYMRINPNKSSSMDQYEAKYNPAYHTIKFDKDHVPVVDVKTDQDGGLNAETYQQVMGDMGKRLQINQQTNDQIKKLQAAKLLPPGIENDPEQYDYIRRHVAANMVRNLVTSEIKTSDQDKAAPAPVIKVHISAEDKKYEPVDLEQIPTEPDGSRDVTNAIGGHVSLGVHASGKLIPASKVVLNPDGTFTFSGPQLDGKGQTQYDKDNGTLMYEPVTLTAAEVQKLANVNKGSKQIKNLIEIAKQQKAASNDPTSILNSVQGAASKEKATAKKGFFGGLKTLFK